jgi:hypothetical protein
MNETNKENDRLEQINSRLYRTVTSPVWDMSQERAFMETLLNQRFNFFLLFYSLSIAGFVNSKGAYLSLVILVAGSIVLTMLACVLYRTQKKLDACLEELSKEPNHPFKLIDDAVGSGGSRRQLIGIWIPIFCCFSLITAIVVYLGFLICRPESLWVK